MTITPHDRYQIAVQNGQDKREVAETEGRHNQDIADIHGAYAVEVERERGFNDRARARVEHTNRLWEDQFRSVHADADHSRRLHESAAASEDRMLEMLIAATLANQGDDLTPEELAEMYAAAKAAAGG